MNQLTCTSSNDLSRRREASKESLQAWLQSHAIGGNWTIVDWAIGGSVTVEGAKIRSFEGFDCSEYNLSFNRCELDSLGRIVAKFASFGDCRIRSVSGIDVKELIYTKCVFFENPLDSIPQRCVTFSVTKCENVPKSLKNIHKKISGACVNFFVEGVESSILGLLKTNVDLRTTLNLIVLLDDDGKNCEFYESVGMLAECRESGKTIVQAQRELIDAGLEAYAEM